MRAKRETRTGSDGLGARELLDREGTDKGKQYGGLYDVLLQPYRAAIRCVVEIGIGTLAPDASATMLGAAAEHYRPGGSLRAWRDFFPNAHIHGIDVAPDTQFEDEWRIRTHLCDSRDCAQVAAVLATIDQPPDLIVDDALHEVGAQTQTLTNFLPALREGGLYVLEDVSIDDVGSIVGALGRIDPRCRHFTYLTDLWWPPLGGAIVIRK
jgi:hypothetical protein